MNNLEQCSPLTWRSEHKTIKVISGYICCLVDEDGVPYNKEAVTNHQMQMLPFSLMNSLQSKEDVELFQMHNMEELYIQDDLNYDYVRVKVMSFINYLTEFHKQYHFLPCLHQVESVDDITN